MIVGCELGDMDNPGNLFKHRSPHHGPIVDIVCIYLLYMHVHMRSGWESGYLLLSSDIPSTGQLSIAVTYSLKWLFGMSIKNKNKNKITWLYETVKYYLILNYKV